MFISTGNRSRKAALQFLTLVMLLMLLTGPAYKVQAQEQVFFGQHLHNRMLYNPAFAGDRAIPGFTFHTRQQWMSWEGSPSSNLLMAHTRLKDKNAGLGVSLAYDRMGPVHYSGFTGMYSYTLQITDKSKLMMGLQGEIRFLQIRLSQLQLVDQGDLLFGEDPGLKLQPNVGLGLNYVSGIYSVNLSVPRILNAELSPFEGESSRWSRRGRVIYMGATSSHAISEEWQVEPSLLVALSGGRSPFIELAGLLRYQERIGMGVLYRFNQTVGGMIRYKHQEMLVFGYSYDVSLGKLRNNVGTHELFLGYNFPFNRTKTLSPRRF